jgi:hypothetical protein
VEALRDKQKILFNGFGMFSFIQITGMHPNISVDIKTLMDEFGKQVNGGKTL